jgi:amino acid adenylation domain-containing protein
MSDPRHQLTEFSPERQQLLARWRAARPTAAPGPEIPRLPRDGRDLPLSFAQQRLWFLDQLQPGNPLYNVPTALRLTGPLDLAALTQSIAAVVARHEILRTTFRATGGEPTQVIAPALAVPLRQQDLTALPAPERAGVIRQRMRAEALQPFDLAAGPLLRALLLRCGADEHILLLTLHHIITDGWSTGVLLRELSAFYAGFAGGRPVALPDLPVQYADFAAWQRTRLSGAALAAQVSYWQQHLSGLAPLALPTDHPRPAIQTHRGATEPLTLPPRLRDALQELAQQAGATLFMVLLAAFQVLLARYSGAQSVAVGSPIAGRTHAALEGLIGFFANTLVLHTNLGGDPSFRELLQRTRAVALAAYTHQELPFEQVVAAIQPPRDLSRPPLFQVMLALQNAPERPLELPGLRVRPVPVARGLATFDLTLALADTPQGLRGGVEYNTDLFERATITRLLGHFHTLLTSIVADPDQRLARLPLLTPGERRRLTAGGTAPGGVDLPGRCLHHQFAAQVRRTPEAVALVGSDRRLTYRELNEQANRLAHYLQTLGVGPDVCVGVCLERGPALIVAVLGILKAGGAYVPLDPRHPAERLATILAESAAPLVLTQRHGLAADPAALHATGAQVICVDTDAAAWAEARTADPPDGATPANLAYIIYTSGSTGGPKGVLVPHRGVANLAAVQARRFAIGPGSRVLQYVAFSFDVWASDVFTALLAGATLYLTPPTALLPGPALLQFLRDQAITAVALPVAVLAALPEGALPALRTLVVGGEACPAELVARWGTAGRHVFNAYGPTEATVCATVARCVADNRPPPIGRPLPRVRVYLLDEAGELAPPGGAGEVYIGGVGLARGYLGRPDLTAAAFVPDPFSATPGARLYRTGDRARWSAGELEFLGRCDRQIKLRGFRIEPGEIETALAQHPAVRESVVVARDAAPGDRRLVAYIVAPPGQPPEGGALRHFLAERLPEYMVPATFVMLDTLPLTPHGKVDYPALPVPAPAAGGAYVAPGPELERSIAGIWQDVLHSAAVGVQDNFFDLGGHSLLLVQVQSRLQEALGRAIPIVDLFRYPTIRALARHLTAEQAGSRAAAQGADRAALRRALTRR